MEVANLLTIMILKREDKITEEQNLKFYNCMTSKLSHFFTLTFVFIFCFLLTHCMHKTDKSGLYEKELFKVDSVRKAYHLSPGDSSISDFFMKEVRYRKFGVSIYRLEDSSDRHYLFGVLKNENYLNIFPLIDNRLLEEQKISQADTNQLDLFLKEILALNGKPTLNWFDQHRFISEKILLPVLDLHEISADIAEKTLIRLKNDTSQLVYRGKDCKADYIKTYEYITTQQKSNAPKFFYKHPRYDSGLIYEMDFANPNGDFKVRYLNEKCFFNYMY